MSILKDYYEQNKNIKNDLQEFIEELKHNQNMNINYVINRLENIIKEA